jgi:hypothetical protein
MRVSMVALAWISDYVLLSYYKLKRVADLQYIKVVMGKQNGQTVDGHYFDEEFVVEAYQKKLCQIENCLMPFFKSRSKLPLIPNRDWFRITLTKFS